MRSPPSNTGKKKPRPKGGKHKTALVQAAIWIEKGGQVNAEGLRKLNDDELDQMIVVAQTELKDRAEKRKQEAIEEIRRIAGSVNIQVTIGSATAKEPMKKARPPLKAGDRYTNPENPAEVYIVGKGRPPGWFEKLRTKGKLPPPMPAMPEPANDNIRPTGKASKAS
jgi:DNA-binding protein H-NS